MGHLTDRSPYYESSQGSIDEKMKSYNRVREDGKWEVRSGVKECGKAVG